MAGWRLSTPARRRDLILAEHGELIGLGVLAIPERQRVALIELLQRYEWHHPDRHRPHPGRPHSAIVHYTARTPTHGYLRDAFVVAVEPVGCDGPSDLAPSKPVQTSGALTQAAVFPGTSTRKRVLLSTFLNGLSHPSQASA